MSRSQTEYCYGKLFFHLAIVKVVEIERVSNMLRTCTRTSAAWQNNTVGCTNYVGNQYKLYCYRQ